MPFPGDPKHYPVREEVVNYLRRYAAYFELPIVTGAWVSKIERIGRLFRVMTATEGCFATRTVVAATGFFDHPNLPNLPGQHQYQGKLLHTADYQNPEPFRGQRVVIVGGANGAVQIGTELAKVAKVTLATRRPIRYIPQQLLGQDIHFWLRLTGLDYTQWLNQKSMLVYDSGIYKTMIAAGHPDRRPMIKGFTQNGIIWNDGRQEHVDAVIFATGYRPHLPYLSGLGALGQTGGVLQHKGISLTVPGLYYVGLYRQRSVASTTIRGAGVDAKVVAKHLRRYCKKQTHPSVHNITQPAQQWAARSSELVNLISLMTLAVKQQGVSSPKLVGDALVHSAIVGAGFFGVGNGAALYSQS
jgi:putative flavoprotein involved in K+ transport